MKISGIFHLEASKWAVSIEEDEEDDDDDEEEEDADEEEEEDDDFGRTRHKLPAMPPPVMLAQAFTRPW